MTDRSIGCLFVPLVKGNFVCAGGVKLFQVVKQRQTVQFHDGDCRRALRRGTPFVEVKIKQLCEMLADVVQEGDVEWVQSQETDT